MSTPGPREGASPLGLLTAFGCGLCLSVSVPVSDALALSWVLSVLCAPGGQATVGAGWREAVCRGGGGLTAC